MNSEIQRPTLIPIQPSQRFNPEAPFFHRSPSKRPTQAMMRPSIMMPNQNPNYPDNPMSLQRPNHDSHSNSPANRNPVMRSFDSSKDMYSPSPKKSTLLQTGNSVLSPYNYGNVQDNFSGFNQGFNPNKSPSLSPNTNQAFVGSNFTQGMNSNYGQPLSPGLGPNSFSQNFNHRPSHFSTRSVGGGGVPGNSLVHKGFANLALMNMPPMQVPDGRGSTGGLPMINSMPNRRGTIIQGNNQNDQNKKEFERLVDSHTQNLEKLVKNIDGRDQFGRPMGMMRQSKSTKNTLIELAGSEIPASYEQRRLQKSSSNQILAQPQQYQRFSSQQFQQQQISHQEDREEEDETEDQDETEEEESRDVVVQPPHQITKSTSMPPVELRSPHKKHTFLKLNARLNSIEVKKKKKGAVDLKRIMWVMAYPILFKASVMKKVEENKTKGSKGMLKRTQDATNFVIEYIRNNCGNSVRNLCKDGKALVMVNADEPDLKKHLSEKEIKKNAIFALGKVIAIFEELVASLTQTNLDDEFISLFADLTLNHAYLPQKHFTEFELSCLEFNSFGGLKNMSPIRVKMMVGNAFLVKGLIYAFMTQPWTVLPNIKDTPVLARGLKSVSAALYHIIMDIYKDNILINKDNQKSVHVDNKIKFVKPNSCFVPEGTSPKVNKEEASNEVLCGFWNRDSLNGCWKHAKEQVEKLKELVMECFDKLYDAVEKAQQEKRMLAGKN